MNHSWSDVTDDGCLGIASQGWLQDSGQLTVPVGDVATYEQPHSQFACDAVRQNCQRSCLKVGSIGTNGWLESQFQSEQQQTGVTTCADCY